MQPHRSVVQGRLRLFAFGCAALLLGCGGGQPITPAGELVDELSGVVFKGPVAQGTVTAYRLDARLERGLPLGSATTDERGAFRIGIPSYVGPVLLVASSGTYTEEAVAAAVRLDGFELSALIPAHKPGGTREGQLVTPLSHLSATLALRYARVDGKELSLALEEAWLHLGGHFGSTDWRTVTPASLTSATGSQLDPASTEGLVLAGLSMLARTISESAGLTPGGAVSAMTVTKALAEDLAHDGFFDGVAASGQLVLPAGMEVQPSGPTASRLDGQTVRVALGQAIARYLASDRNESRVAFTDATELVRSLSRNSNPRIFRTPGQDFDSKPPALSFRASFKASDGTLLEAVGASKLVGGPLSLVVEATDASVVKSLTVTLGAVPVPAVQGESAPSRFVGTWAAKSEGPLTFTAKAVDLYDNAGEAQFTVVVDTTPPRIGITAPKPAFLSSGVAVDALATDANGIGTFSVSGLPGFADQDSAPERVFGAWSFPTDLADGPLAASFSACDVVRNCVAVPLGLSVDRSPPTVQLAGTPPAPYTRNSSLSLTVLADDGAGAGVKQVYALSGSAGGVPIAGQFLQGTWRFPSISLVPGANAIEIWADDESSPPNSGRGNAAHLVLTVLLDTSPPPITKSPLPSYVSEEKADLQKLADGRPVTPVQYTFPPGAQKVDIGDPGVATLYKLATRLSWGASTPTGAELEGANPNNLPVFQFAIPFDPVQDSPISSVTYEINIQLCGGCTSTQATGKLIPAAKQATGFLFFDLPLARETVPQLAMASPVSLETTIHVEDAAGNKNLLWLGSKLVRHVAPPLALVEDTSYANGFDPKSAYAYRMANGTYHQLFEATNGNFAADGVLRVARYLVYNPAPVPVGFYATATTGSAWSLQEDWGGDVQALAPSDTSTYAMDGFALQRAYSWDSAAGSSYHQDCPGDWKPEQSFPCGDGQKDVMFPWHAAGNSATKFVCRNLAQKPPYAPVAQGISTPSGLAEFRYFQNPSFSGNETTAAAQLALTNLYNVVPAATGNVPGVLAMYIAHPRATVSNSVARQERPLVYQTLPIAPGARYQFLKGDLWQPTASTYCCKTWQSSCSYWHAGYHWYEYLAAARRTTAVAFDVVTLGLRPDGNSFAPVGPSRTYLAGQQFLKQFNH